MSRALGLVRLGALLFAGLALALPAYGQFGGQRGGARTGAQGGGMKGNCQKGGMGMTPNMSMGFGSPMAGGNMTMGSPMSYGMGVPMNPMQMQMLMNQSAAYQNPFAQMGGFQNQFGMQGFNGFNAQANPLQNLSPQQIAQLQALLQQMQANNGQQNMLQNVNGLQGNVGLGNLNAGLQAK